MTQAFDEGRKKTASENAGREMPAVKTTIVGGRPPGCGKDLGDIPRGIDVLIKKAAIDQVFRKLLLARRAKAADEIGLILVPEEAALLEIVPAAQLEAIIAKTHVEPSKRPAFLGKAAAVMLVALGASGAQQARAEQPAATNQPSQTQSQLVAQVPGAVRLQIAAGVRDPNADTTLKKTPDATTQPASAPASQPASRPALTKEQRAEIDKLIMQLDSDEFAKRDEAYKKLKDIGQSVVPVLKEIASNKELSSEVAARIQLIIESFNPPKRPKQIVAQRGARPVVIEIEDGSDGTDKIDAQLVAQIPPAVRLQVVAGARAPDANAELKTPNKAATQPASAPASQPASQPALTKEQRAEIDKLIMQLDSDEFNVRDAAYSKLKEMGKPVVPVLNEIAANKKLSEEVATRIKLIIDSINPPPVKIARPARVLAQDGVRVQVQDNDGSEGTDNIQDKTDPKAPPQKEAVKVESPAAEEPARLTPEQQKELEKRKIMAEMELKRKIAAAKSDRTDQASDAPATQPATQPALTTEQRAEVDKLVEQLDSDEFTKRDEAYKKLKDMGPAVVPALKEIASNKKLSEEVAARIQLLVESFNLSGRPEKIEAANGIRINRLVIQGGAGGNVVVQGGGGQAQVVVQVAAGGQPPQPDSQPATASAPASQPATQPSGLTPAQRTQVDKLIEQLDSDDVAIRDEAHKKIKAMGQPVVPVLKEIVSKRKLSDEVATRIKTIVDSFKPVNETEKSQPIILPNGEMVFPGPNGQPAIRLKIQGGNAQVAVQDVEKTDEGDKTVQQPKARLEIGSRPLPRTGTQPASQPASQPATQPGGLTAEQRTEVNKLVEQMDSDEFATRDAAHKKLKEMGKPVVPVLKEIAANRKLSDEAASRIKLIIDSINPPPKPANPRKIQISAGERIEVPADDGSEGADKINAQVVAQVDVAGARADYPNTNGQLHKTATQPASRPASQPATQPGLTKEQRAEVDKLVEQLDSNEFATRDAAHKKLKDMGKPVVPAIKEIIAQKKVSQEVLARLQIIVESFAPPERPSQIAPVRGVRIVAGAKAELNQDE